MAQRKPYNPNTRYGRKKLRDQAAYNYEPLHKPSEFFKQTQKQKFF